MGLFEKIKNALFEEEYVEIEEKPKKPKKEILKKEVERPIAKKVLLPKKEEIKVEELDEAEYLDEDFEIHPKKEEVISEVFDEEVVEEPEVLEEEFEHREERGFRHAEPSIVKVFEKEEHSVKEDVHYYQPKKEKTPYGIDSSSRVNVSEYGRNNDSAQYSGLYERKEERTHFKPSPIISPIYGILDKNYKKEDVVTKKEVRLTSSYAKENLSVDDVRKKAYGSLSDDIAKGINEPVKVEAESTFEVEHHEDENLLVDLSNDKDKPAVKEVTMGDALEYFEDLGLEYNVDYVDASKDRAIGRRSKEEYDDVPQITQEIPIVDEELDVPKEENKNVNIDSDDNLFDLIDSMYKEND